MPRRTRIFFAKLIRFFNQYFGSPPPTSSSLDANVPLTGPPATAQQPQPPPTTQQPQPPATAECPRPPATAQWPQPPALLLPPGPPHTSNKPLPPIPSSAIATEKRVPILRVGEPGSFAGARNFNIHNSQFHDFGTNNKFVTNDFSQAGSGLKELLKHSMPDAFHDSAARYPPPKCHLGTRKEHITKVIDWALGNSDHNEPILWMRGPFGVGKSAVAQSCAEALQLQNKLIATLFFSRSNADRDDPLRVFTSIAYQIAAIYEPFSSIVDARIRKDPAITTKSLSVQFKELLVRPLSQVNIAASGIDGCVVVIDGLDECRGSPGQCEIVEVIATSAREQTTPFRWFITSRPEDPIIRTMKSLAVSRVSLHLELPVSREIDHEILLYLTDEFNGIRERHGLADSWPPEEVTSLLVERAAGLWIYITTIVRFIKDENSYGPEDQLQVVVRFLKDVSTKVGPGNPFAEIDFLYTLIMQRIPEKIRKTIREILLIHATIARFLSFTSLTPAVAAATVGLTEKQFRHLCASIQSAMTLQGPGLHFYFYHASFLDFMKDPARSKELCIHGDFLIERRREYLDWAHQVCSRSTGPWDIQLPTGPVFLEDWDSSRCYTVNITYLWHLCGEPNHPLDIQTATSLAKLQFVRMLWLVDSEIFVNPALALRIRDNLPTELRDKIIRKDKCPTPGCTNTKKVWILGHRENETVARSLNAGFLLENNQDPDPGWCFCGSPIEKESDSKT